MDMQLILQGADAREAAQVLAGVLAGAGVRASVHELQEDPHGTRHADPAVVAGVVFAAATFVLAIPPAVLAVLDLKDHAERLKKRRQAEELLEALRKFCKEKQVSVLFRSESEDKILLDMDADTLLEWAGKLYKK